MFFLGKLSCFIWFLCSLGTAVSLCHMTVKGWDGMENPNWRILIAVTAHVQFPPVLDEESHSIAMFSLYFTELHSSINSS